MGCARSVLFTVGIHGWHAMATLRQWAGSKHDLVVDSIDRAILLQLHRDAHLTNTELADRVGLTPSPCLRRVRRLEQDGVILGYTARIDPAALGRQFEVHVEFELATQGRPAVREFESALTAFDEVIEARRMFGRPDYQALVAVADLHAYERFMTERLMALPHPGRLESRFAMKTIKADLRL
jgi:DNA-binding Lrp family transcriptional regulator